MRYTIRSFKIWAVLIVICTTLMVSTITGAEPCDPWAAKLVSIQGEAMVQRHAQTEWHSIGFGDLICQGDTLKVGQNSRASIMLAGEGLLRLDQDTTLSFPKPDMDSSFWVDLIKGVVHFFSHKPRHLKVLTPFVNGNVEGTEFVVKVENTQTLISVLQGRVAAANKLGRVSLAKGQSAVARADQAPVISVIARPRDTVQWALYYPPMIYAAPGDTPEEDLNDPQFLAYRASQLLGVGRVNEAASDIERALDIDSNNSDAFALQSIIAVVQNKKEKALKSAQKAVKMDPNSATAYLALSYAQQAGFDLESARANVEEAVKLDPNNALAWARLAELHSSLGRLDKALNAAKKAVELNPDLSRTHMVLGFAYLTQVKTALSKAAFEKAIELDQADPLSRLGLGLAKIREGYLKAGGREIEIAAGLDPNNSIVRSYLGKVYFEEKHDKQAAKQLSMAKELDPNDPTPWFYSAITKQTTNRPVEALYDLQKAIELNDNRAVYRSRLMLDADEAARSASLARIYSDLGFQQRALVEGWQAVNTDPSNFSAHRFLADSYVVLPRHEIARVSELLQSQLLQPLNIIPIQPQLAESNQFLINAGGPADLSFNEFNSLFNRNRTTFNSSGLVGSHDTYGGEGVVSGIYNRLSMSAGYTHFETDGWRQNADQKDDITNIFTQYKISYKTSIQTEYRHRNSERGDLAQLFFEDSFAPNRRLNDKVDQGRLGFHHTFSPRSDLIANFQYVNSDIDDLDSYPTITRFDTEFEEEGLGGELSYLLRSRRFNIVAGGGYYQINRDKATFADYLGEPWIRETIEANVDHTNIYLYSHLKPLEKLIISVGASGDFFDQEDDAEKDRDQFNPKLGVSWSPLSSTTLRVAAFRVLKRTLITNQTIEPTQVAGFNQFYDEANATDYWVYGGAVDQKFTDSLYGGTEFIYRKLKVPFRGLESGEVKDSDWDESLIRAYLFWTPYNWLSVSGEYLFESLKRDEVFTARGPKKADTHRVPLGINLFHPSGFSASFKGTLVNQDGLFDVQDEESAVSIFGEGDDDFFLVDAAISYRLPNRFGSLTIGAKNLTDQNFEYFNTDVNNIFFQPTRIIYGKITFALP